jgi:hypothetical protein
MCWPTRSPIARRWARKSDLDRLVGRRSPEVQIGSTIRGALTVRRVWGQETRAQPERHCPSSSLRLVVFLSGEIRTVTTKSRPRQKHRSRRRSAT